MLKNKLHEIIKSQIFYIFVLALIIRLFFIFLDYPFVLHPDEPTVVNSTINLRYDLNPKHFDWPTFYYYFTYPFFFVFEKVYFVLHDFGVVKSVVIDPYSYYVISRFITILFGASTTVLIFLILRNLKFSDSMSLLGACILALLPFHVTRSAQALTDVPMVFMAGLTLYFLTKSLYEFNSKYFLWACFFAGLCVSTKYNGYMIFLTLSLFLILIKGLSFKDYSLYFKSALFSFLGFFVGTPYAIFDYKTFLITENSKGALWQFTNVGKVGIYTQLSNFFNNLFLGSYSLMGYVPLILSITFIVWYFVSKQFLKKDLNNKFYLILIIQFLFIFWSVSGVKLQRSHYLILAYLLLPLFSIFILDKVKNFKYIVGIYALTVALSFYSLYNRIDDPAIIKFYKSVVLNGNSKDYLVSYDNSNTLKVLEKMKLPVVKFNPKNLNFSSKVTHVVSTTDICINKVICSFDLIDKIDSRGDTEVIYVYQRK